MRIGFLLAALPLPLAERTRFIANEGLEFPRSCESGLLELNGIYEISARVKFEKSCTLRGSPGTSIELAQQLLVLGDLTLEGHLQITASAENDDTCLVVPTGILTIATDELVISRCTSFGSITAQNLHIRGHMQILDSYSARDGGGIRVLESVVQHTGILTFANCSSKRSGGAVHVQGSYEQLGGSASFVNCTSGDESDVEAASQDTKTDGGGGLSVGEMFRQQGGVMRFEACRSIFNGGGLQVRVGKQPKLSVKLLQAGRMSFSACAAGRRGGGASVNGPVQLKGRMVFEACKAGLGPGGGLHVSDFMELSGSLTATSCSAGLEDGGGLHVAHGLRQTAGSMRFYNCSTVKKGGGIKVARGGMKLTGGDRSFDNCSAGVSGGGLYVHYEGVQLIGSISFRSCSAKREGGAAFVQYGGFHQSSEALQDSVSCLNCSAGSRSGALYVGGSASFSSPVHLSQCRDSSSTPFAVAGPLELRYVHILEKGEQHACITADAMNVSKANCTSAGQCEFTSKQPNVTRLLCKQGRGRTDDVSQGTQIGAVGCYICDAGRIQPFNDSMPNPPCIKCPSGVRSCTSERLQMQRGYMISKANMTQRYHCPNAIACPGGDLPEELVPMCSPGYSGLGCTDCIETHGSADNTVLSCVPCATSVSKWAVQAFYSIVKDAVIFALAISSVMTAGSEAMHSTVLLNQLMSFATVAGTALSAVMQTSTFSKLSESLQNLLVGSGIMVDVAQGGQSGGLSTSCLAEFVGLPKRLWMAHILRSATPAVLIAFLSIYKDPWLALVVGTNCFLPEFCAGFGKYLVCFRVEKERKGGELMCSFLPDIPAATALITGMIILCFLVGVCGWMLAASSKTTPKPPHVVYLTNAYKEEFAAWEVERLVRKMLLTLVGAVLPITLAPALQLACLSVILVLSLVAYLHLLPYKEKAFNLIEAALLSDALIVTALSNSLLANDSNWAKTEATNQLLLFVTALLATAGAGGMLLLLIRAHLREHAAGAKSPEASD